MSVLGASPAALPTYLPCPILSRPPGQPQSWFPFMSLGDDISTPTWRIPFKFCGRVSYVIIAREPQPGARENSEAGAVA